MGTSPASGSGYLGKRRYTSKIRDKKATGLKVFFL